MLAPRALQVSRLLKGLRELRNTATVIAADPVQPITGIISDTQLAGFYEGAYRRVGISYGRAAGGPDNPDVDDLWVKEAVKEALYLWSSNHYDCIVTFAQPWFDHRIGLNLRKQVGPPWIAHFSDPWVDSPYYDNITSETRSSWTVEEAKVIEEADAIVFTTAETASLVMAKYPAQLRAKAHVVPHAYDPALMAAVVPAPRGERLRLTYLGDFYEGRRTPSTLFRAVARLAGLPNWRNRIELILVGLVPDRYLREAAEMGLSETVACRDRIPFFEALAIAAASDILVSIDAPADNNVFLPSKLVDYLMFEKPILALTPARGSVAQLMQAANLPTAEPTDIESTVHVLERLLKQVAAGQRVGEAFRRTASAYDIAVVARKFATLIDQVIDSCVQS
jgi:glycosyltransferase involved in cell wall biosynthesis